MNSRRIKAIAVFILVVGGGYGVAAFVNTLGRVPQELSDARLRGATISENIVDLSRKSASDLDKINELDKQRNYEEAIRITTDVVRQSQEIRDKAVLLSDQISAMTKSLSKINSLEARQALLDAITNRLALVSRLINYSGYLGQLLDILHDHFAGASFKNSDVTRLVNQINSEVTAINSFNKQAAQAMEKFDMILAR